MQVKVATAEPLAPAGDAALTAYLKRVKHVGPSRAERLLQRYGDDVLEAIDQDPHAAFRAAGLNPRRTNEAIRSWNGLRSSRALHLLLAPHGLAWLVPRIAKEYGDRAHQIVRERPYELTSVFGVGFHTADTIARAGGIAGRLARARTRRRDPRAGRGGEGRLDVPAGGRARGEARARCSARRRAARAAARDGRRRRAGAGRRRGRRRLGVPAADRGARGRAGAAGP